MSKNKVLAIIAVFLALPDLINSGLALIAVNVCLPPSVTFIANVFGFLLLIGAAVNSDNKDNDNDGHEDPPQE